MARLIFARALTPEDGNTLKPIDEAYALAFGLEPILTRSSLSFYTRSGHSFVAMKEGVARGFVLAQSVWNGTRPTVFVNRLAVAAVNDVEARQALLEAVTKSAYDAAVYDIQVQQSGRDQAAVQALFDKQYKPTEMKVYERILGSRGNQGVRE